MTLTSNSNDMYVSCDNTDTRSGKSRAESNIRKVTSQNVAQGVQVKAVALSTIKYPAYSSIGEPVLILRFFAI